MEGDEEKLEWPDGYTPPPIHTPAVGLQSIETFLQPLDEYTSDVELHIGCRFGDLELTKRILDLYSLYHGIYVRASVSRSHSVIINDKKSDGVELIVSSKKGELVEGVSGLPLFKPTMEEYLTEFYNFYSSVKQNHRDKPKKELDEQLKARGISDSIAKNYWRYITGEDISKNYGDFLSPRRDMACAWPLGCTQNIELENVKYKEDHFPWFAGRLSRERDHCRPQQITRDTDLHPAKNALQPMCKYHNRMKRDMPLWDVETLNKIFSEEVNLL
jgi:hypothetical protein